MTKKVKLKNLYKLILNKLQGCAYPVALSYVLPTPLPQLHCPATSPWPPPEMLYLEYTGNNLLPAPKSPASMSPGAQPAPLRLVQLKASHRRPAAPGISRLGPIS